MSEQLKKSNRNKVVGIGSYIIGLALGGAAIALKGVGMMSQSANK